MLAYALHAGHSSKGAEEVDQKYSKEVLKSGQGAHLLKQMKMKVWLLSKTSDDLRFKMTLAPLVLKGA